jgi:DNA-binding SARP family transcriptional activator
MAVDGERDLSGRKTWALLAFLLLEPRPPSRRELAARLFPEADDPLAALRWTLLQVRRALGPGGEITDDGSRLILRLEEGFRADAVALLEGTWDPADDLPESGELLEGFSFDDSPEFETWLALQRARVASAWLGALRWTAALLARTDPQRSLALIERALVVEPFDDGLHELAVDVMVGSGNREGAAAHVQRVDRRYREELGVPAPETLRRPLDRPAAPDAGPLVRLDIAARAMLDTARARLEAGDYEGALTAARRSAADAAGSGDRLLEARALTAVAKTLIHTLKGRDPEAMGLLTRALHLASELGDPATVSDVEGELGFVAFLDAAYGAAEASMSRAMAAAREVPDPVREARATIYLGLSRSDRCDYEAARGDLEHAIELLGETPERGLQAYAMAGLSRALLKIGDRDGARRAGLAAEAQAVEVGALSFLPWTIVHAGEAALLDGERDWAEESFGRAFTMGCEIGDPCWESLSMRGLGLIAVRDGDEERAAGMFEDALGRATRLIDAYRWSEAVILTDLAETGDGLDPVRLQSAVALAAAGPMPDLFQRLRARQTREQTVN